MFMVTLFPAVRTPKQSELTNRRIVRKYTTEYWLVMEKENSVMSKNLGKPQNTVRREQSQAQEDKHRTISLICAIDRSWALKSKTTMVLVRGGDRLDDSMKWWLWSSVISSEWHPHRDTHFFTHTHKWSQKRLSGGTYLEPSPLTAALVYRQMSMWHFIMNENLSTGNEKSG